MVTCELAYRLGQPVKLELDQVKDPEVKAADIDGFNRHGNCIYLRVQMGDLRCGHYNGQVFFTRKELSQRHVTPQDITDLCPAATKARSLPGVDAQTKEARPPAE